MAELLVAGIETGGTKIIARIARADGTAVDERRWPTASPEQALADLLPFLQSAGAPLAAIGMAAFGPLVINRRAANYGQMLATTKPGWTGSNLRSALEQALGAPVVVDTDVNAAAIAEQALGAGRGCPQLAYVTVGTGIGAGLAIEGEGLHGAMHPEAGHLPLSRRPEDMVPSVCPFHDGCVEGLASGPAVRRRLGEGRDLADEPAVAALIADYLGQLAASLVLAWSPQRIVWGGGVIISSALVGQIGAEARRALNGYGVGSAIDDPQFCARASLADAGLEGAVLLALRAAGLAPG